MNMKIDNYFIVKAKVRSMAVSVVLSIVLIVSFIFNYEAPLCLFFIPLYYVFLFVFFTDFFQKINTPGLLIVNALYFLRFYLVPLFMIMSKPYSFFESNTIGIYLLLFEELAISACIPFVNKIMKNSKSITKSKVFINNKKCLYVFILLFASVLIISLIKRDAFSTYHSVFNLSDSLLTSYGSISSSLSTVEGLIVFSFISLFPFFIAIVFHLLYKKKKRNVYFYIAMLASLFFSIFVIEGTDRGTVVLKGIVCMFVLIKLFPEKRKIVFFSAFIMIALFTSYFIIIRMAVDSSNSIKRTASSIADYLQSYVAGISNMTGAYNTYIEYGSKFSLELIYNDVFSNVPILSHYATTNCSNYYFNYVVGRGFAQDQVMPMIGNGMMAFGIAFSPILTMCNLLLVTRMDSYYVKCNDAFAAFTIAFAVSCIAFVHYQSVQLNMLYWSCRIMPIFLIYFVYKELCRINNEKKNILCINSSI